MLQFQNKPPGTSKTMMQRKQLFYPVERRVCTKCSCFAHRELGLLGSWTQHIVLSGNSPPVSILLYKKFTHFPGIIRVWCNQLWSISSKYTTGRPVLSQCTHQSRHPILTVKNAEAENTTCKSKTLPRQPPPSPKNKPPLYQSKGVSGGKKS